MADGKYDDEIWDEHQWEAYLDEIEQKSKQLRKFIASDKDETALAGLPFSAKIRTLMTL